MKMDAPKRQIYLHNVEMYPGITCNNKVGPFHKPFQITEDDPFPGVKRII